jgi:NAD(P)H-dependent FMN reductase
MKLDVIVASTRPGRAGLPIAQWFLERAQQHARFEVELVDLKEVALPLIDEPKHPRLGQYTQEHTRAWSARVRAADAFVFVTPEYNFGAPPALINAIDYLFAEWQYKPVAFVSYGGVSGGTRSVQMTKQVVTTLKMVPIVESVTIPFFQNQMEGGAFKGSDVLSDAAKVLLDELHRWAGALRPMRG